MTKKPNDLLFWGRVLANLSKHKDQVYVPELIANVEENIRKLKENT